MNTENHLSKQRKKEPKKMDYISIPDENASRSLKKSLWRLKTDFVNNNRNMRKKVSLTTLSLLFFWYFIIPIFSSNSRYASKDLDIIQSDSANFNMKTHFDPLIQRYNKLPTNAPLRAQLAFYFPYDEHSTIPNRIFQTWKVSADNKNFPKRLIGAYNSWSNRNENFTHTIITDDMIDEWIFQEFSNVPMVIEAWKLLPKFILKADFFRYLVIFARGGIYSDIDTYCLKPISNWALFDPKYLPENSKLNSIGLAIGIEADPDRPDWAEWYARRIQFVQWTVVGKRGHPFLRELIARIVEETLRKQELGMLKRVEGKDAGGDIMQWTGPGMFTDTFFDYINNVVSDGAYGDGFGVGTNYWKNGKKYLLKKQELDSKGLPLHSADMTVNWMKFTGLKQPAIYDDIMVLPITSFSPGVGQMGSMSPEHALAFVLHMFEGSWKT